MLIRRGDPSSIAFGGEKGVLYIERVEDFKPLVVAVAEYGLIETVELFLEFGVEVQGTGAISLAAAVGET